MRLHPWHMMHSAEFWYFILFLFSQLTKILWELKLYFHGQDNINNVSREGKVYDYKVLRLDYGGTFFIGDELRSNLGRLACEKLGDRTIQQEERCN